MAAVMDQGQTITFCGAYAHFQNGIAEKRIRDLQDQARTLLIHAKARWPTAITTALWPYALRAANEAHAYTPRPKEQLSPIEKFSRTSVQPKLTDFHPFGCPAYVI